MTEARIEHNIEREVEMLHLVIKWRMHSNLNTEATNFYSFRRRCDHRQRLQDRCVGILHHKQQEAKLNQISVFAFSLLPCLARD